MPCTSCELVGLLCLHAHAGMDGRALEEWSNDEIRQALLDNGQKDLPVTPTTKPLLLRKLRKLLGRAQAAGETSDKGKEEELDNESKLSTAPATPSRQHVNESRLFEGYYGVAAGCAEPNAALQLSPFYTSKAEVLKAIKCLPGARFKRFESQEGAEAFSQPGEPNPSNLALQCPASASSPVLDLAEKPNSFPSLKTQQLTQFRGLIESGDVVCFADSVWSNPRYLISSGDAPVILQLGCRYNALHCAVLARKLDVCRELFVILESERFWSLVYPDDVEETRANRKNHLLDLYLNMQDSAKNETPLHFASKHGYEEIVSFLMSFPTVRTDVRNHYQETPSDVACRNAKNPNKQRKERIQELIKAPEVYYVPVLRAVDNSIPAQLGSPCTSEEYTRSLVGSPYSSPVVGQAFAGPMSPSKAKEFYRDWRSPSQDRERKETSHVKRSDPRKGWERVGRQIAASQGIGWTEYWEFLGCYCDLSAHEGLQKLEQYIANLHLSPTQNTSVHLPSNTLQNGSELSESPLPISTGAERLTDALASLDLSGEDHDSVGHADHLQSLAHSPPGPEAGAHGFVTPVKNGRKSWQEETSQVFLTGAVPSKLDYDVLLAISETHIDPHLFPHIHHWLELVKSYTEQERRNWRTPTSVQRHQGLTSSSHSLPVSPLVFSSPTLSPLHRHRQAAAHTTPRRPLTPNYPRLSSIAMKLL